MTSAEHEYIFHTGRIGLTQEESNNFLVLGFTVGVGVQAIHVADVHVQSMHYYALSGLQDIGVHRDLAHNWIWRLKLCIHL